MNLDLIIYQVWWIPVHFLKVRPEKSFCQFYGGCQNHIEHFSVVFLIIGMLEERGCIKNLIKQELQIPFANEFFGHYSILLI
ncbi:hypothetical protein ES703_103215 [subsurface metagenome]